MKVNLLRDELIILSKKTFTIIFYEMHNKYINLFSNKSKK